MIMGTYPCCDEGLAIACPLGVQLPKYMSDKCPGCGTTCWHKISRVDPTSWTEEDFLKEFDVDPDTKTVTAKKGEITTG